MKFRCPYCRTVFEGVHATCPSCSKTMNIPTHLTGKTFRDRKRAKKKIRRRADLEMRQVAAREPPVGRKPMQLVIILAFMGVLAFILMGRLHVSEIKQEENRPPPQLTADEELNILRAAVELFHRDCRRYPRATGGFWSLLTNPGNTSWNGPYVNVVKQDPWGNPYIYNITSDAVTILSTGPDGTRGTDDDMFPSDWESIMPPPE